MISKFKDWLLVNGASYNTAQNYLYRMQILFAKVPEDTLSKDTIQAFLLSLHDKGSVSTINGYLNAIRSYLKYIKKDIELPTALKQPKTLPDSFDEKYLEDNIIPTISQICAEDYLKYRALFYFLFFAGIRISEINSLMRKDFDLKGRTAKIYMQKTRKERIVFYNEKTKSALEDYFNYEPEETNAFNTTALNVKQRIWKFKPNFPDINLHIHLFRHSFALNLLRKGVDLLSVSNLLGHSNINSTMRYLGLTTDQMQTIYNSKIK